MDELVKRLRDFAAELRKADDALLVRDAADAIEDLEFACKRYEKDYKDLCAYLPRWIPVSEKLPDENGNYLVSIKCPKGQWVEICSFYERDWCSTDEYAEITTKWVTHWQPLPKPPKEG